MGATGLSRLVLAEETFEGAEHDFWVAQRGVVVGRCQLETNWHLGAPELRIKHLEVDGGRFWVLSSPEQHGRHRGCDQVGRGRCSMTTERRVRLYDAQVCSSPSAATGAGSFRGGVG